MSAIAGVIMRAIRPRRVARIAVAGSLAAAGLLVTAQAAGASWLQLDTPVVPGASVWEFNAVSCTSPNICMAVGDSSSAGGNQLLSETRSRSGWTIQPIPQPAAGSVLLGVWCTSASACTAVGDAPHGSNGSVPLAERWNGSSWQIQATPKPKRAPNSQLTGVTCTSAHACVAVGSASMSVSNKVPLAEHWNGTSWKIEKTPTRSGFIESELDGISCPSATRCIAVGDSFKPSKFVTLAELWNGTRWSIQVTPNSPAGGALHGISCPSRNDCMAVGDGLGARWNGTKWSLVKLGFPGTPASLGSVSCTKAGACYADGGFFSEAILTGVIEIWNGSRWRVQNAVISAANDSSVYNGISCTTATNCTAVGSYHDPVDGNRALAEDFSLRWQDVSPMPLNGVNATSLASVSCASPNACVTVGTFETSTAFETFSETWDGSTWTFQLPPKPKISNLDAVSCPAVSTCIAVGDIQSGGTLVTLAERWNGLHWTIQGTRNQPGATGNFLLSVSCPSTTDCTAVGRSNLPGGQAALAERWNGKVWRIQHTPKPAGQSQTSLAGVSCTSASACEAVGAGTAGTFAESWNGRKWTAHRTPLPKGGRDGFLAAVSCRAANACTAVGDYLHGSHQVPLAERWNGTNWRPERVPVPPGATTSGLESVSCTSATSCAAVGFRTVSATNAIAMRWNGRTWSIQQIQPPLGGSQSSTLSSVSCNSAAACMAAGSYVDLTPTEQMLAEQYS